MSEWPFRVPLFGRDRSVRAWALVDEADLYDLLGFRWHLTGEGYASRAVYVPGGSNQTVLMHRALLGLAFNGGGQVDHINRDRLDNRRGNLRPATAALNAQNVAGRLLTSAYRGVSWQKAARKWKAQVRMGGVTYYLGLFDDEELAAQAARSFRLANMAGAVA